MSHHVQMVVPCAGIGEDARAVHALEERLSHRVLLGHHHVRVTAAKVVDVIDGAVDILDDLDKRQVLFLYQLSQYKLNLLI